MQRKIKHIFVLLLFCSFFFFCSFIHFRPAKLGVDNIVYLITDESKGVVLKVYTKKDLQSVQGLASNLEELRAHGHKIPRCLDIFEIGQYPAMLNEYCEGTHPFDPTHDELQAIAKEMALLHQSSLSSPPSKVPLSKELLLDLIAKCPSLAHKESIQKLILDLDLNYIENLPQGLVHGDFSPSNLLMQADSVRAVLDFDHFGTCDLLSDLARSQIFFAFNEEKFSLIKCQEFVKAYESVRSLTSDEKSFFYSHILIHLLKMYLETYYYVDEIKEVKREIFTGLRANQSPEALFNKLVDYLKEMSILNGTCVCTPG